jgi:hypothetical protein
LLRQSIFGRLAGYEDVNDAERLRHDPGYALDRRRQSGAEERGFAESQWLAAAKNFAALADLSGQWIDLVRGRRPPVASCSTWIQA